MSRSLDEELGDELERLSAAGQRRELRRWVGPHGPRIELGGRALVSFSSNNYLGLAGDPALSAAAGGALAEAGLGAAASRLIAGNHAEHEALEAELAELHRTEAALLFNSGFQANIGVIPALVGRGDLVLSDHLNHASLIDGCRLSRAAVEVYPHGDVAVVELILAARRPAARRALVVTESVFSMDGDRAPLAELASVCARNGAWLMVDEAHAVAALGPGGRGIAAEVGVRPDVLVGTLGKGFGTFGAYVAGSQVLRQLLIHRARSFVFTTALPPAVAAASRAAVALVAGPEGERRRALLAGHIERFGGALRAAGLLAPGAGSSAIFPVILGSERRAMEAAARLAEEGFHVQGIRPPTVPPGTSRLRVSLMATHGTDQVDALARAITSLEL
ncbi:MAG TPA: 8-amino-7-oxononanoate synthase [Kofleriaceae bacterium]|nr:8-amino-7-oxononanoate synthase [Kofleriaceae bacterium]